MKSYRTVLLAIYLTFSLSACGPGQVFGPTVTSTPTITLTPTSTPTATSTPLPTFTPTLKPTPIVYDGDWFGTISSGGKISFKVSENGIASIKISFGITIKNGSCNITMDTSISPPLDISLNQFSLSTTELKIKGVFDSATTASGTVEASANSAHCSGGVNVTWTAEKE
jgi:hypothetical protein